MNQSLLVTKRDGTTERINLDKIHRVLDWAAEGLNNVSISQVELRSHIQFYDGIKNCRYSRNYHQGRGGSYLPRRSGLPVSRRASGDFHLRKKAYGQFEAAGAVRSRHKDGQQG
ncbi:Ribonucleoside-diphosphate reductase 1 subunit alpha [Raoultella terrigena]|uniref:Ribonucleoside-diphosphate reductase 1 subunit alpha n=1 Tax=Raoultella terrigena TaxID=577 RepID=A0A3P8JFW4_RAOTE|nr:Ribonucleoside-diphosphate reductase 1 subunit alpha [Raoultella terrigena]